MISATYNHPLTRDMISPFSVTFVESLTGLSATIKVAFGTEGGLFSSNLSIPTVVCGPGSMEQGHKLDEYVSIEQLNKCDQMLDALMTRLEHGL